MTEEQTGGTTPETEAQASVADQASEQAAGVAIADEPAETATIATTEASEPPAPAALEADATTEASEPPTLAALEADATTEPVEPPAPAPPRRGRGE